MQLQLPDPTAEIALLGQIVHVTDPATLLYVPASHAVQLPPLPAFPV